MSSIKTFKSAICALGIGLFSVIPSFAMPGTRPAADYTQRSLNHADVVKVRSVLSDLQAGDLVINLEVEAIAMQPQARIEFFVDGVLNSNLNFSLSNVRQNFTLPLNKKNGIDYKSIQLRSIGKTVVTKIVANIYDPYYVNPEDPVLPPPPPPPVGPGPGPTPYGNCRTVSKDRVFSGSSESQVVNECKLSGNTDNNECEANSVCQNPVMTCHTQSTTSSGILVKIHGYDRETTRAKCHKHPITRNAECDQNLSCDGHSPIYPPNPPPVIVTPPPVIVTPPPPPPSEIRGKIYRMDDQGVISGYVCDRHTSRNVRVMLEIGNELIGAQIADQYLSSSEMGSPSFDGCGSATGFKFVVDPARYAGLSVRAEISAISPINNVRVAVDDELHTYPLLRLDMGVFKHGNTIYFSEGIHSGTYCHLPTMDHVRIYQQYVSGEKRVSSLPTLMTNRGVCEARPVRKGLFQQIVRPGMSKEDIEKIYYSNGTDAFCRLTHPDHIKGRSHPRLVDELPTNTLRNDGDCAAPY